MVIDVSVRTILLVTGLAVCEGCSDRARAVVDGSSSTDWEAPPEESPDGAVKHANACGGWMPLSQPPGLPCDGPDADLCDDDSYECRGRDETTCSRGGDDGEACNGLDENCDGIVDEGCDDDGDDWCDSAMAATGASPSCPAGFGDCADNDGRVHPGAIETCNEVDEDCDGETDEGSNDCGGACPLVAVGSACDGDDGDRCEEGFWACSGPNTVVCSDATATVVESCNGLDDDCDGVTDDGLRPAFLWARQAIGDGGSNDVTATNDGGAVLVGQFTGGNLTFGSGEGTETTLTAPDAGYEIFLAKYEADGAFAWARRAGGIYNEYAYGVGQAPDGSLLVVGGFEGPATFGPGEMEETTLTPAGGSDIFVAKYDSEGTLVWVRQAGGTSHDSALGVDVDDVEEMLVAGAFRESAVFGPGEPEEATLVASSDWEDTFVAKYGSDGTLAWAAGAGQRRGRGIASAGDGGAFLPANGVLARCATRGALVWAQEAHAFSTSVDGNLGMGAVIAGNFGVPLGDPGTPMATFGAGQLNETTLVGVGGRDAFVARYDTDGVLSWARGGGSAYHDEGYHLALAPDGSALVVGSFWYEATFDGGGAGPTTLTSPVAGLFVGRYDENGGLVWARGETAVLFEGFGVAVSSRGSGYVSGRSSSGSFGVGSPNATTLADGTVFLAKYSLVCE